MDPFYLTFINSFLFPFALKRNGTISLKQRPGEPLLFYLTFLFSNHWLFDTIKTSKFLYKKNKDRGASFISTRQDRIRAKGTAGKGKNAEEPPYLLTVVLGLSKTSPGLSPVGGALSNVWESMLVSNFCDAGISILAFFMTKDLKEDHCEKV
ncbi:hypothetical protein FYJ52_01870 [Eubacteriaceae bacterium RF-744-FAT-4]|uniref:Uncharacterized protein n=1 Tax=Pseudoramibacter porci TaxID=2606631 RepID=A0A7X2NEY2_9FIRM|nr:hypothetical protein [Pseudoramibacter porci]